MKLDLYNQKAEKVGNFEGNETVFSGRINDKVLAQYVYIYLSNQREANAHTKDRSDVSGGGKKPWAQKGTGRARVGSNRSPIWKGGGVTFGPTNKVNWKRKTTRTFRQAAFRSALAKVNKAELLNFVDKFEIDKKKALTKQAMEMKKNFGEPKKMLIITSEKNQDLINAFSNIGKSRVALVSEISVYDLLTGGKILIEEKALEYINSKWAK